MVFFCSMMLSTYTIFYLMFSVANCKENECPLYNIEYQEGSDIGVINHVDTWRECGQLCNNMRGQVTCNYWSWQDNWGDNCCTLKSSNKGNMIKNRTISGDKSCK